MKLFKNLFSKKEKEGMDSLGNWQQPTLFPELKAGICLKLKGVLQLYRDLNAQAPLLLPKIQRENRLMIL